MNAYLIEDENDLPEGLVEDVKAGYKVYCESVIGPIAVDEPDFRNGITYYTGEEV